MAVSKRKVAEALIKGRDYLKANKWHRGDLFARRDDGYVLTKCCALGAVLAGNGWATPSGFNGNRYTETYELAQDELQHDIGFSVTEFNDLRAKDKRAVVRQFDRTIKRLQSELAG